MGLVAKAEAGYLSGLLPASVVKFWKIQKYLSDHIFGYYSSVDPLRVET